MGGCVGTSRRRRDGDGSRRPSAAFSDSTSNPDSVSTKNRPLRHEKVKITIYVYANKTSVLNLLRSEIFNMALSLLHLL